VYLARSVGRHTGATPLWLLQDFPEMFHLRLTKRALGRAASAVHGIIADSHYLLDKVVAPAAGQPVHVICPGVEEAFFAAPARARPPFDRPKELRTLWLGNPAPYKGYRVYAQAVAALRGQGWDVKSTLVGPASLRALDTVGSRLLTDLSDGQLAQLYTEHDVCISTSTREGFGLPPLESMAAGTPAVLVDSGGPRDYARDGENCFVVPEANAEFIAASVRKLANDPGLVDRLRMAGRQTAERFHWAQLQQDFAKAVAAMARPRG
jgi:glycosyltransferase involved in cell wall biosynthesis